MLDGDELNVAIFAALGFLFTFYHILVAGGASIRRLYVNFSQYKVYLKLRLKRFNSYGLGYHKKPRATASRIPVKKQNLNYTGCVLPERV
jgi:hypothetical protein